MMMGDFKNVMKEKLLSNIQNYGDKNNNSNNTLLKTGKGHKS